MLEFVETEVRALYRRAGFTLSDAPGPVMLARCILGYNGVLEHTGLKHHTAAWNRADRCIYVRPGIDPRRLSFGVGHELGEMLLSEMGYAEPDAEQLCDSIAGGIVCPRDAFRISYDSFDGDLPKLAAAFVTSEKVLSLRVGEVLGTPVALVTPRHVHVRGDAFEWGDPSNLRRIASGKMVVPEIVRRSLTDDARSIMLIAA